MRDRFRVCRDVHYPSGIPRIRIDSSLDEHFILSSSHKRVPRHALTRRINSLESTTWLMNTHVSFGSQSAATICKLKVNAPDAQLVEAFKAEGYVVDASCSHNDEEEL